MSALPGAEAVLRRIIGDGLVATGAQLSVAVEGDVVADLAVGTTLGDIPMEVGHLHPSFCASKPLLGLVVGLLVDDGRLDLDDPVPLPSGGTAPLRMLLNHGIGLDRPRAVEWRMAPAADRARLRRLPAGDAPAYSEVAAGLLVEDVVAEATGRTASAAVEELVLHPLGIADHVVVDPDRADQPAVRRRLSVPFAGLPDARIPMLSERVLLADLGPTLGGVASAAGMGRLYAAVERALSGATVAGVPTPATLRVLVADRRGPRPDPVLDRVCDFAGGFAVDLTEHGFGYAVSRRAVGHVGAGGHTVGLADPEAAVAVGLYFNGVSIGLGGVEEAARAAIVDEVLAEVRGR